jgi:anti-anti-sigma factor
MKLQVHHKIIQPGTVVITPVGRVTLGSDSEQVETLVSQLLSQGHRNFIFDMSEVSHIDSTGIGRFISSFNKVRQVGGKLRMAGATGQVRDGFRVTRLDTVFQFYPDVEAASEGLS